MTTHPFRRPPRGRAVLVCAAVVFVATQLVAGFAFDYRWPQVRFPVFYLSLERLENGPRSPNVVFLGSSRTGHLVLDDEVNAVMRDVTGDPAVEAFNASVVGGDVIVSERMLHELLERGVAPRYVVIEVSPEQVCCRNAWLRNYHFMLLHWSDLPGYCTELAVNHELARFIAVRCVPLYYYRDPLRKEIARQTLAWYAGLPAGAHGAEPSSVRPPGTAPQWHQLIAADLGRPTIDPDRMTTRNLADVPRWFRNYQIGGNAAAALERLLGECRARGIEPILYSPPLSSAHRCCYTAAVEAPYQEYMAAITAKYACRYVDYRTLLPDAFFIDHHHCGPEGMPLFSRKIALEVLAPAWIMR